MKNLIKILSLILIISFINIETNANPFNLFKKGLELGKKIEKFKKTIPKFKKISPSDELANEQLIYSLKGTYIEKINRIIEKTTNTKEHCLNVNKKINDEEYRNNILEKLAEENEELEESLSSENNSKTMFLLRCTWSSGKCTCIPKKSLLPLKKKSDQ